jgi:hypothetical protein
MKRLSTSALIAAALLIGGCSSQSDPAVPNVKDLPAATHGSLADCLHDNGIPDSSEPAAVLGPPNGVDQAVWDQAMKACSTLAPGPGS